MTEADWLNCTDPTPMLAFLRNSGKLTERKARLFAVACCRRIWPQMTDDRGRHAVEVAERLADGMATNAERRVAALAAGTIEGGAGGAASCSVGVHAFHAAERASGNAALILGRAVSTEPYLRRGAYNPAYGQAITQVAAKEVAAQTSLLRDIIGPLPFRRITLPPSVRTWNDGTVVRLAQAAYEERELLSGHLDLALLGVLADVLEEAGCQDQDILGHLRQPGVVHVRGCWCLDLVLDRK